MSRFVLSRQADADLDGIADYLAAHSPRAAVRQIRRLYERLALLGTHPFLGELRDDLRPGLRILVVDRYQILYFAQQDGIEVAGVVHGAQDLEGMFRTGER